MFVLFVKVDLVIVFDIGFVYMVNVMYILIIGFYVYYNFECIGLYYYCYYVVFVY